MTINKEKNQKEDIKTSHKIQSLASVLFERSCSRFQAIQEMVDPNKWYQSQGSVILDVPRYWLHHDKRAHSPGAQAPFVKVARPVPAAVGKMTRQERAPARGHHRADHRAGSAGRELPGVDENELLRLGRSHARDAAGKGLWNAVTEGRRTTRRTTWLWRSLPRRCCQS
jgi:hypothetical protein